MKQMNALKHQQQIYPSSLDEANEFLQANKHLESPDREKPTHRTGQSRRFRARVPPFFGLSCVGSPWLLAFRPRLPPKPLLNEHKRWTKHLGGVYDVCWEPVIYNVPMLPLFCCVEW